MKILGAILGAILTIAVFTVGFNMGKFDEKQLVSGVNVSNEYRAVYSQPLGTQTAVLSTGPATLGSLVITGANTGSLKVYNATTSDVTKRALATSSLTILAATPSSLAAGTYVFDVSATQGLLYDWSSTLIPTSTLTWR